MRIFATFLCFFLLLLFFGTLTYVYILWRHYWIRVEKINRDMQKHNYHHRVRIRHQEAAAAARRRESSEGTFAVPLLIPQDKLLAHVDHYQTQIVFQLRNAAVETGKSVRSGEIKNSYGVTYNGSLSSVLQLKDDPSKLVCDAVRNMKIETFLQGDPFFREQQLDQYFLPSALLNDSAAFDTCAVVSSSGSLKDSGLGARIDANDFVIRFNNAPTGGEHARDVGSKTSLRIVNSQVVGRPQFKFLESQDMYADPPVLVWDPSSYDGSLQRWYANPDYPFFETFFSRRLMRPFDKLHLLRPASLWSLWDWLQAHSKYPLLPNPPSSGFLGLAVALGHCRHVHVYEYVPSMRLTKRCHYYDVEENLGCTMGDWHPLAAEKLVSLAMNVGDKTQVYSDGYLTIPGCVGGKSK